MTQYPHGAFLMRYFLDRAKSDGSSRLSTGAEVGRPLGKMVSVHFSPVAHRGKMN
jgi:hypothetical protein